MKLSERVPLSLAMLLLSAVAVSCTPTTTTTGGQIVVVVVLVGPIAALRWKLPQNEFHIEFNRCSISEYSAAINVIQSLCFITVDFRPDGIL